MLTETLIKLFKRDLGKLKVEVDSYRNEANLWIVTIPNLINVYDNLCLHLVGNLNYFIGAILGDSGYIRQRDLEFSLKDISKSELITQINNTIEVVESTLSSISKEDLQKEYKRLVFEDTMTTEYFLVHLTTHLAYHLGQINYHRRLLD